MPKTPLILLLALLVPSYACAVSDNIKEMCIDDYLTFCNQFDVGTPELTSCMKSSIDQLSEDCRNALKSEGYKGEESTSERSTNTQENTNLQEMPNVEEKPDVQDEPKAKIKILKKQAKSFTKIKQSTVKKTASQSTISKSFTTKAKAVTVPKRLDIPQSVGSSISVYGAY